MLEPLPGYDAWKTREPEYVDEPDFTTFAADGYYRDLAVDALQTLHELTLSWEQDYDGYETPWDSMQRDLKEFFGVKDDEVRKPHWDANKHRRLKELAKEFKDAAERLERYAKSPHKPFEEEGNGNG